MCLNRNSWQKSDDVVAVGPFLLMQSQASSIYNLQLAAQYRAADVLACHVSGWRKPVSRSLDTRHA